MEDKSVESGLPMDGGADEKLAYLAKQITQDNATSFQAGQLTPSLNIQIDASGRQLAAGFSFRLA